MSWSTKPKFNEALQVVNEEPQNPTVVKHSLITSLKEIVPFNNGAPFRGETHGYHTNIFFESPSLSKAVLWTTIIKIILKKKFPEDTGKNRGEIRILFNGKSLVKLLEDLNI